MSTATLPEVVRGYRLREPVGEGGVGTVFAATRESDGMDVALKVLRSGLVDEPQAAARFQREAETLRTLRHPNLVQVLDVGTFPDGRPFYVMPLLKGRNLRAELARPLPPQRAWQLLRPVALALSTVHQAGVIHRDIKPENIFLDESDAPRLLDFGLARTHAPAERLTSTGIPLGTPHYMPPEQWWNRDVGPASDQYALTAVFFEMLAGRPPFDGDAYVAVMQAHLSAVPPSLRSLGVDVDDALEGVLARGLAKDPAARFPSVAMWMEAVDAALGVTVAAPAAPVLTRLGMAAVAPLALLAAGHAGSHDPRLWAHLAGYAFWPTVMAFLVGAVHLARRRQTSVPVSALMPAALGATGTWTGYLAIVSKLPELDPARHFEVFNEGLGEASVNRFVGFGLSSGLLLAALVTASGPVDHTARREGRWVAAVLGVLALCAVLLGAPSGALVMGLAALAHVLVSSTSRSVREELPFALHRLLVVGMAAVAAHARVEAREAVLWSWQDTRAARVLEMLAANAEMTATTTLSTLALLTTLAFSALRLRRVGRSVWQPDRGTALLATTMLLWIATDLAIRSQMTTRRSEVRAALTPMFELFAHLDPPVARAGLPSPHLAPSLRVGRDVVALDSQRVGLTASLSSTEGLGALGLDLSHRLARAEAPLPDGVQLLVMVDRRVSWQRVARALGVAYGLGIRRVELLLTRGAPPQIPARAPPEAALALPMDFSAVPAELVTDGGHVFPSEMPFEHVAAQLAPTSEAPLSLRVERAN
ncbi:MAG: serine/threonine-protein kinase [Myxococcota bacterium]